MAPKAAERDDAGSNHTVKGASFYFALVVGAIGCYFSFLNPDTAQRVQKAVLQPDGVTETEFRDNLVFSCACIFICGMFDLLVARLFGPARYFALHVVVNCITVPFAWNDFVTFMSTGNSAFEMNSCSIEATRCSTKLTVCITVGIHLWHTLAYALKPIDWVHHIPAHICCSIGIFFPWGPSLNACCIALMGIPGGIDYFLLVLVKLGKLPALVEKNLNQTLNVWMRCPIAVYVGAVMMFGAVCVPEHFTGSAHRAATFIFGLHSYWNGCFFMYRTVDARTRFIAKLKEAKKN